MQESEEFLTSYQSYAKNTLILYSLYSLRNDVRPRVIIFVCKLPHILGVLLAIIMYYDEMNLTLMFICVVIDLE